MKKLRLLVLTRYDSTGASTRVRFMQYFPILINNGWEILHQPLLGDRYINHLYKNTAMPYAEIIKNYFRRISLLMNSDEYEVVWLQQEAFPWIPALFEKILLSAGKTLIVDYDDAFFHRYDMNALSIIRALLGKKIDMVMNRADCVVTGNNYLAARAKKNYAKRVTIIPTVVDVSKYSPAEVVNDKFTIGWIGSPSTSKYLNSIGGALKSMQAQDAVRLVLVGSGLFEPAEFTAEKVDWSEDSEISAIRKFDVGIMPLDNTPWEKGKCGYKLIQYMACGKPVVASPVGVNSEIVVHGENGFLAESEKEWIEYLTILKNDPDLRKRMGAAGRKLIEEKYSLQVNAPRLIEIISRTVDEKKRK